MGTITIHELKNAAENDDATTAGDATTGLSHVTIRAIHIGGRSREGSPVSKHCMGELYGRMASL